MISIIIPVYNQSKELNDCLASIHKQSYDNYEIIIVNDFSSDGIGKVVSKYKAIFGVRLEYIENDKNMGAPASRNKGFGYAKGEYIIFCDADSVLQDDMLKKMCKTIKSDEKIAYVYSSFYWGKKKFKLFPFDEEKLKQMPYIHSNTLIRKERFPQKGWDESLKRLQDWDLWLTMLEQGDKGVWIDEFLFKINDTKGTMSAWLPSICYKICPFLPKVKKYKKAVEIIKNKHNLNENK